MTTIRVDAREGQRFGIAVRGHALTVDQPVEAGGTDTAPTPTELFVAGLASCVAHYARGYLVRHGLDATGLRVWADFAMSTDRPARVARIDVRIEPPADLPDERRDALLAVASHCTVHNSLTITPDVSVAFGSGEEGAAA